MIMGPTEEQIAKVGNGSLMRWMDQISPRHSVRNFNSLW